MGGVNMNEDIIIDKSIHRSINARSSVLKVRGLSPALLL
jgi:choline transporter-like protein 2/4/5